MSIVVGHRQRRQSVSVSWYLWLAKTPSVTLVEVCGRHAILVSALLSIGLSLTRASLPNNQCAISSQMISSSSTTIKAPDRLDPYYIRVENFELEESEANLAGSNTPSEFWEILDYDDNDNSYKMGEHRNRISSHCLSQSLTPWPNHSHCGGRSIEMILSNSSPSTLYRTGLYGEWWR